MIIIRKKEIKSKKEKEKSLEYFGTFSHHEMGLRAVGLSSHIVGVSLLIC